MERDVGDILDRWSIARLKMERIKSTESQKEYAAFNAEKMDLGKKYPAYDWEHISGLIYDINEFIWQLEAGLKSGKEALPAPHYLLDPQNKDALANIGTSTILIRNYNHLRVKFKNLVNQMTQTGFQDTKKDHLSEGE